MSFIIDVSTQLGTSNLNSSIINSIIQLPYITSNIYFSNIEPSLLQYCSNSFVNSNVFYFNVANISNLIELNSNLFQNYTLSSFSSNWNGIGGVVPNDNYCNGIILNKTNNTNVGYWNLVPNNYNYIRYISKLSWTTYCTIIGISN